MNRLTRTILQILTLINNLTELTLIKIILRAIIINIHAILMRYYTSESIEFPR